MFVCTCVCMHACMYICMHVCMYVHMHLTCSQRDIKEPRIERVRLKSTRAANQKEKILAPNCYRKPRMKTHGKKMQLTMLQHTAALCETLQHTATLCYTVQHSAALCYTLRHTATHYHAQRHTATHCNTLQHTARPPVWMRHVTLQHNAAYCYTLRHTATHCNTLQHNGNTLQNTSKHLQRSAVKTNGRVLSIADARQHTATHYNTPATHCNALQHACNTLQRTTTRLQHTATHCNTLATHCNTLQHACNTLQHTCNTVLSKWMGASSASLASISAMIRCVLQFVAVCYSVLQRVAACCSVLQSLNLRKDKVRALHYVLQCVALHCRCGAVCCSVPESPQWKGARVAGCVAGSDGIKRKILICVCEYTWVSPSDWFFSFQQKNRKLFKQQCVKIPNRSNSPLQTWKVMAKWPLWPLLLM